MGDHSAKIEEIFQVISINVIRREQSYDLEKPQGFETVTLRIHRQLIALRAAELARVA